MRASVWESERSRTFRPGLTSMKVVSNSPDAARRTLSNGDEMIVLACQQTVLLYYCNCRIWYSPGMRGPVAAVTVKAYLGTNRDRPLELAGSVGGA